MKDKKKCNYSIHIKIANFLSIQKKFKPSWAFNFRLALCVRWKIPRIKISNRSAGVILRYRQFQLTSDTSQTFASYMSIFCMQGLSVIGSIQLESRIKTLKVPLGDTLVYLRLGCSDWGTKYQPKTIIHGKK